MGRGLAIRTFSICMCRVNDFVRDDHNAVSPRTVVVAINLGVGLANTVTELLRTNRGSENVEKWIEISEERQSSLKLIRTANEISYEMEKGGNMYTI